MREIFAALLALFVAVAASAQPPGRGRALLIGINDYTASRLSPQSHIPLPPDRDWTDLTGAVNDVGAMRQMLVLLYGFRETDIMTLTDQQATRAAILQSLERHLVKGTAKGDVVLFYYAGHGSQVRNSLSDETDRMDESIVPADSRLGVPDIRDKELRPLFNAIVDKGARLTVILDNCHSGSGARGSPAGARSRSVDADVRDVADAAGAAPRPEDRGALVLSAAQDFDQAWETRDEQGKFHGAFSWSLLRAMRDSSAGESASDTFLRARARMRAEMPFQEPVMAGNAQACLRSFLGGRIDRRDDRNVVFVEKVRNDGTVLLQGGWAHGLSVGTELRAGATRLKVTAMTGFARSQARVEGGQVLPAAIKPGAMLEVVDWSAPMGRPLRLWMPPAAAAFAGDIAYCRGIVRTERAEEADYVLMTRRTSGRLEYAWKSKEPKRGLPLRTEWVSDAEALHTAALRLRRIHAWNLIESPAGARGPYQLALRARDGELAKDVLIGEEEYDVVLRSAAPPTEKIRQRYVYVFVIDSCGNSVLLFPRRGSVENRLPVTLPAPREIRLGEDGAFEVAPPYGVDTFFLLTTDEPLPDPWVLQWDGLPTRGVNFPIAPTSWSLQKVAYHSIPPRKEGR